MPSRLAGRIAIVLGLAAVVCLVVLTLVPPPVQVLAAILTLPIGASLCASATASQHRRVR